MRFKYLFLIGTIMIVLSASVAGKDEEANEKLNIAFRACEKGLKMKMPKSHGSLRILQSHFNSYQRNRDAALQIDDTLKSSKSEYYEGTLFTKKTFVEVYDVCEKTFAQKVAEANAQVSEKVQGIEAKQKQHQAELEKNEHAKQQVAFAINEYCANYMHSQGGSTSSSLYHSYQTAKQKSMATYPDIVKEYYTATFKNPSSGMISRFNKSVKEWFEYCDKVFIGQAEKLVPIVRPEKNESEGEPVEEGPPLKQQGEQPPIKTQEQAKSSRQEDTLKSEEPPKKAQNVAPSTSPETSPKEAKIPHQTTEISSDEDKTITDEDKTEYEGVIANMKGDRLKILKEEKRLPDFVNDEDYNYQKADIWQFEKDNGGKCSIYNFHGDQLAKAQKDFKGECPSF